MIKTEEGNTEIKGEYAEILADLACIIGCIMRAMEGRRSKQKIKMDVLDAYKLAINEEEK